jgi:hypothetical protein
MKPDHIRKFIKPKGRFHPFTVRTASGEGYAVRSPEFVWMPGDGEIVMVYEPGEGVTMIDADEVTECHREIKRRGEKPQDGTERS